MNDIKFQVEAGSACWKCKVNMITEADVKAAKGQEWPLCKSCREELILEVIDEPGEIVGAGDA